MTGDDLRREMWVHDEAATPRAGKKKQARAQPMKAIAPITPIAIPGAQ